MPVGSSTSTQPVDTRFNPIKEATEIQERVVSKIIEDQVEQQQALQEQTQTNQANSGAELTGVGTTLDVRA